MIAAAIVVVLVTVVFAGVGPHLANRLPPDAATRLLVPTSLAIAVSGVWVLGAVAVTWAAQLPTVSRYGHWSPEQVRAGTPFPAALGLTSALLMPVIVGRVATIGTRRLGGLLMARDAGRKLGQNGPLVVVDCTRPVAFATPGPSGRIVITTGLLRALTPDQRRALLAHEASHIANYHAWWLFGSAVASAANPVLAPVDRAIGHTVERWADEDAAREVTDRKLVARTIARAALLVRADGAPAASLGAATSGDIPRRVQALIEPAPRPRAAPLAALAVLLAASLLATGTMQTRADRVLDNAKTVAPRPGLHSGRPHGHP